MADTNGQLLARIDERVEALTRWRAHVDGKLEVIDAKLDGVSQNYAGCSEAQRIRWTQHERQHDQDKSKQTAAMAGAAGTGVVGILTAVTALVRDLLQP